MNLPDGWTTDRVHTNGIELQYYRTGNGPPLVMAHGFSDNGRCWARLAADLGNDYEVTTYDARGHGASDAPETGYDIENRVADLVGLVSTLDLTDPVLVGHSMGGSTAAWTAATHPDLPRALVCEDPAGMYPPDHGPDERVRMVRADLDDRTGRSVAEAVATTYADEEPQLARRLAVSDAECSPNVVEIAREGYPQLTEAFAEIQCPTLVLKADADPARRATDLDRADRLTAGRLVHVHGAGHCVLRDRYAAGYAELRTFLRRV